MSSCEVLLEEPSGDASSLAAADKSDEPMLTCLTFIFHWNIPIVRTLNFIGSPKWPEMRTSWRLFLDHCKVFTQPNPLAIIFKLQLVRNEEYSAQITSMPDTYHSAFFSGGNYRILEGNSLLNCLTDGFLF
ncbi:unnamed protein product [Gongylonema pulchrum]|uniref:Uncharacterized protein n=1 Tax=Gongylonema pulchrum TaxID=637853 RepID=A0A183D123_9BILA|nr:unnamed protein product [Gongylonema pulchrum]